MKRTILGWVLLMLLPATALGAVSLSLTGPSGAIDIIAGPTTFTVDVYLNATGSETVTGVSYWLKEATSAGFGLDAVTLTSSVFDEASGAGALDGLDPINTRDLGCLDSSYTGLTGPFSEKIATITIDATGVAFGAYTFETSNSGVAGSDVWTDQYFTGHAIDAHGSVLVDPIIPEPMSALLWLVGMVFLRQRRTLV